MNWRSILVLILFLALIVCLGPTGLIWIGLFFTFGLPILLLLVFIASYIAYRVN